MSFDKLLTHASENRHSSDGDKTPSAKSFKSLSKEQFSKAYPLQYFTHDGHRSHFVDTGQGQHERTVLCLHSRFGWAYSFRKIMPKLVYHGYRVIALDMLGFGLSDKPEDRSRLTVEAQCSRAKALIENLGLKELTLIGHEMGAGIAAQLPRMLPETIEAIIFANPAGRVLENEWPGLHMWRTLMNARTGIDIGGEIARICPNLTSDEVLAYNEPLTAPNGLFGVRHFHDTVALDKEDPDHALMTEGYAWLREEWTGRHFVMAGAEDPVFGIDAAKHFCAQIGCTSGVIQIDKVCGHPFEQQADCIDIVINKLFEAR